MATLLIVDDDPAWRALYRLAFEGQFEVVEATDGEQALSLVGSARPDVILLDIRMPRMDGLDLIRELERRGLHLPIVVCSGVIDEGERPAIAGARVALKSPDLKDVWRALGEVLPGVSQSPAAPQRLPTAEDSFWRD